MPISKRELDAMRERNTERRKLTFPEKVDLLNDEELQDYLQNVIRRLQEVAHNEWEIDRDELKRLVDNIKIIERIQRVRRMQAEEQARFISRLP